jgi:serine/threonine protein kinase
MLHQRYRLLHTLGQGGMGAVYIAQDTRLGDRLIAIKEMSMSRLEPQDIPLAVERFKQEAHILARLHHHSLPVIYDHFNEEERWYLAMSFIEGGTLQSYLNDVPDHKLPLKEAGRIGRELCSVLDYLHSHQPQIIFRDLKPSNIMITPKGQVYLIDFGIARHFKQDQSRDTAYYYSVGYAPPEQYGQSQTGPRSDIYSLGAVLHQMLSSHSPASRPFHFAHLQLLDPTIPVPLATLIAQMLDMNENLRPSSMAVVKVELEKILAPSPKAEPEQPPKSAQPTPVAPPPSVSFTTLPQSPPPAPSEKKTTQRQGWNAFFQHRTTQIMLWIIFTLLNAGAAMAGASLQNYYDYRYSLEAPWVTITGSGAIVLGLIFLFVRNKRRMDLIGGFLFIVFSIIVITVIKALYYHHGSYYSNENSYIVIQIMSFIWLLVGTGVFLRAANPALSLAAGPIITLAGIALTSAYTNYFPALPVIMMLFGMLVFIIEIVRLTKNTQKARKEAGKMRP